MHHISFTLKGKPYSFNAPSVWNELTRKQLLQWMTVMHENTDEEAKLRLAVPIFYGLNGKAFGALKESQRLLIAPTLRKLLQSNRLNKWVIPSFRLFFKKYHGPAEKLTNLTAHEFFNICEPLYWKWKETADFDALNALIAVLYRPKRKGLVDDDIREPVTDAGIAKRARRFQYLNPMFKVAIAFNYEGCRNFITQTHQAAFNKNTGTSKKRGDVTLSLAGGPLGDHTATKQTNLYTFLLHLVNLIEQEDELKRRNQ